MAGIIQILFVDDNEELCSLFKLFLEETGEFQVHICTSAGSALNYLNNTLVQAVISDFDMPDINGVGLLLRIREVYPTLPFIMLTGKDSKETAIEALNAGADFYQNKGEDLEIQILDIAHKVKILVAKQFAEDAGRRKDAILEAISYAAERFLTGDDWNRETDDVLKRIGTATNAGYLSLWNVEKDPESGNPQMRRLSSWAAPHEDLYGFDCDHLFIRESFPSWYRRLINNEVIRAVVPDLPDEYKNLLNETGFGSLLLIPIFMNSTWWGVLWIADKDPGRVWVPVEVNAIRIAADVIGAARYRLYIEEVFRNPVEESLVGVFLIQNDHFAYVNPRFCEIFGYSRDEVLKRTLQDLVSAADIREIQDLYARVLSGEKPHAHLPFNGVRRDGTSIYLDMYLTSIEYQGIPCGIGNLMDITKQQQANHALAESEERFRELFNQIQDLIILHELPVDSIPGKILRMNAVASERLGYSPEEYTTFTFPDLCPPNKREGCRGHCTSMSHVPDITFETLFIGSGKEAIPVEVHSHRYTMDKKMVILSVARDISERKQAEAKIKAADELLKRNMLTSIREKETLLREIHHRVKNNMQIITSLLKLQDYQEEDPRIHEIVRDSRNRILSMAIIHEKLYQTENLSDIVLDEYFRELGRRIIDEFEDQDERITLDILSEGRVIVDVSVGIPLGLIMNELITNSMKYAFAKGDYGTISIMISQTESELQIRFSDTGVGLPDNFEEKSTRSLGMRLVTNLVCQVGGELSSSTEDGAVFHLTIPLQESKITGNDDE